VISPALRAELGALLGERIRFDAALSRYTSLRVGGPAAAVAAPADRWELAALLRLCAARGLRHVAIGGGFNSLARDTGLDAVVIHLRHFRRLEERPGYLLRADAGVSHSQVLNFCARRGFGGLEFAAGIPGTVGGWVAMNAGVPARDVSQVLVEVEVLSPCGRQRRHIPREQLRLRYRELRGLAKGSLIVSALLAVTKRPAAEVRAEIERRLTERARKQPLDVPSCGSVFVNPRGDYAGRLIESVGLKGHRIGGAQISPVHANFIANLGGARAADVLELIALAQREVERATGIRLEREVRMMGEDT
jgi:UDP-N-acetylmuramate dehydrogenase